MRSVCAKRRSDLFSLTVTESRRYRRCRDVQPIRDLLQRRSVWNVEIVDIKGSEKRLTLDFDSELGTSVAPQ